MSRAQHGYVDPLSADKVAVRWNWWGRSSGAVPDWRRSDIDVSPALCLDMTCGDWCRRSFHASQAPSSACINMNAKVTLNQTLGEQGIVGKSAMLSCTYIPTNVYTAWCYVCGLPTCKREFVLEGVTKTWGSRRVESIYVICPCSLATLTLWGWSFNP